MCVSESVTFVTRGDEVHEVVVENSTEKQLTGLVLSDMAVELRNVVEGYVAKWCADEYPIPFTIYLSKHGAGINISPYMRTLPMHDECVLGPVRKFMTAPQPKSIRRRKRKPIPEGVLVIDA